MKALLKILAVLVGVLEKWQRKQEADKHAAEVKKIDEDPNAWFADHFGGVPDQQPPAGPDKTDTEHGNGA